MKRLSAFLDKPCPPLAPVFVIVFVSLGRLILENAIYAAHPSTVASIRDLLTMMIFYTVVFFMFSALFTLVLSRSFETALKLVCVGLLGGLIPPLLHPLFAADSAVRYIYFSSFSLTLFARDQPLSESVTLWAIIAGCGVVVALLKKSVARTIAALLGAYAIFQGCSLIFLAVKGRSFQPELPVNLAFLGLALVCYIGLRIKSLHGSLSRIVHGLPHCLLVACGAAWAGRSLEGTAERMGIVLLVVFFLIVQNDHYDRRQDRPSARRGLIEHQDVVWTNFFTILLFLWAIRALPLLALMIALFFVTGLLYHHPAIRLKERFCLSYKLEGISGLLAFLSGTVARDGFPKERFLWLPGLLVFLGATVLSIPKDWKDVGADADAGIPTYYVVLGRAGRSQQVIHRLLTALVTICLLVPPMAFIVTDGARWVFFVLAGMAVAPGAALLLVAKKELAVKAYLVLLAAYLCLLVPASMLFRGAAI